MLKYRIKQTLITLFILSLGLFIGYKIGVHAQGQFIKAIVEPGSMVTEASYVIFTDGTNYYARNGLTGEIEFQSTNASYVINNVLTSLTGGGEVVLKDGTYSLTSPIKITNSGVTLRGSSKGATILDPVGVNGLEVGVTGSDIWHVKISDLYFYGSTDSTAIILRNPQNAVVERVWIEDYPEGILLECDINCNYNTFYDINTLRCTIPFHVNGTANSNGNIMYRGKFVGWRTKPSGSIGIKIERGDTFRFYGVSVENYDTGVLILNPANSHQFYGSRIEGVNVAINLTGKNNYFSGGTISNVATSIIANSGTGNRFSNVNGLVTENSGSFTSIANGTAITHSLTGTPTTVVITLSVQGYAWYSANSTHITLYFSVPTASGSWYAEYKP
jgi:hypothetical protein